MLHINYIYFRVCVYIYLLINICMYIYWEKEKRKNKKLVPVVASKMGNCVVKGQGYERDLPFTWCPFTIFEFCTVYIYFLIKMNNQTNYKNKTKTCAYAGTEYYIHLSVCLPLQIETRGQLHSSLYLL